MPPKKGKPISEKVPSSSAVVEGGDTGKTTIQKPSESRAALKSKKEKKGKPLPDSAVIEEPEVQLKGDGEGSDVVDEKTKDGVVNLTPQEQAALDLEIHLRQIEEEEKLALIQNNAARKIQAVWRGFMVRFKLRICNLSAIKIQAGIRGFLGRRRVWKILQEKAEEIFQKDLNEAATKIQAAWKGHASRKKNHNFKDYKEIQEKNNSLKKSIESINKVEEVFVKKASKASKSSISKTTPSSSPEESKHKKASIPSIHPESTARQSRSSLQEVNEVLRESIPDLAKLSADRVAELHAYASDGDLDLDSRRPSFGIRKLEIKPRQSDGWDGKDVSSSTPKTVRSLKSFSVLTRPGCSDSVDALFPEFPNNIEGLIRPDPGKVEALKQAIRLLKKRIVTEEERELQKHHHLLRTNRPGIYSNIYCNELTEFEQQVKSVKYWTPPPDPRLKKQKSVQKNSISEEEADRDYEEEDNEEEKVDEDEEEEIRSSSSIEEDNHVEDEENVEDGSSQEEEKHDDEEGDFETLDMDEADFDVNENFEMKHPQQIHA